MIYFVYVLYSAVLNKYYVGHSANLEDRLFRHNNSGSKFTKQTNDWKIMHFEQFDTKSAAYQGELEIKGKKSRKYIEWLISSAG